jgi:NAD(P)-dependent dehydrogenase (short-subunit alcohol dehydrogenase family)
MTKLNNKIILITGATSGIGKVAATELARMGAHVILHGRNEQKTQTVKEEVVSKCGHNNVDIIIGDMSSMDDVRRMAEQFNATYDRLDVLVNNAGGVMDATKQVSVDNMERTFAVNVASLFLLTALLFEKLKKSENARIVNVSSMAHKFAQPDLQDIQLEKKYTSGRAYANAKLYVVMLTEELHRRMRNAGINHIDVNALHPGVVATNFAKESKGSVMNFFFSTFGFMFISPLKGAQTTIFLASSDNMNGVSGKYFAKSKQVKAKRTYLKPENMQKLWNYCEQITGVSFEIQSEITHVTVSTKESTLNA